MVIMNTEIQIMAITSLQGGMEMMVLAVNFLQKEQNDHEQTGKHCLVSE